MIEQVTPLWKARRSKVTLLAMLDQNPASFRNCNVRLVVFREPIENKESEDNYEPIWEQVKREYRDRREHYEREGYPFYVDHSGWQAKDGDLIIDYWLMGKKPRHLEYGGIWRMRGPSQVPVTDKTVYLADQLDNLVGISFPAYEQKKLHDRITKYLETVLIEDKFYVPIDVQLSELPKRCPGIVKAN